MELNMEKIWNMERLQKYCIELGQILENCNRPIFLAKKMQIILKDFIVGRQLLNFFSRHSEIRDKSKTNKEER